MEKLQRYIVVDDDKTNNLICEHIIKIWDPKANIRLYLDPQLALNDIAEDNHNVGVDTVLFLDVNMPTMSGWEFLDVFRKIDEDRRKSYRIFILTSSIEDFSKEAEEYPFVSGFLSKPLKKEDLERMDKEVKMV